MIPMRTSTVFKSRWMALLWAAGIIWFALDYTSSGGQSANNSQTDSNQTANATG